MNTLSFTDFLWEYKAKLALGIFLIFFVVYTLLAFFGMLPDAFKAEPENTNPFSTVAGAYATTSNAAVVATSTATSSVKTAVKSKPITNVPIVYARGGEDPVRVVIEKIGVDTRVSNPQTTKVSVLDQYLQSGAVHYPGSAGLGAGNVFMFGHSTGLRVVNNQAYKAFNNFRFLNPGDIVKAYSLDNEYTYKVERVRLADDNEVFVNLTTNKNMLTLSTCNTFGEKQERYVVEASFVSVKTIDVESI